MTAYTLDHAAKLLNMGRNTFIRRLREAGLLGADNLPTGRGRGGKHFEVRTSTFEHPVTGWKHYGRTYITASGLDYVADRLGVQIGHIPAGRIRQQQQRTTQRAHY